MIRTAGILAAAVLVAMAGCGRSSGGADDPIAPPAPPDEGEPNDSIGAAKFLGAAGGTYSNEGRIDPAGDGDYFSVDVLVGSIVTVDLTNLPADYDLELVDGGAALVASSNSASTISERIVHVAATAGLYAIRVFGVGGAFDAGQNYLLTVDVTFPGALVPGFGSNGIIQVNPDPGPFDAFNDAAVDFAGGVMYLAGGAGDGLGTNFMWRIEKRLLSDGSLVGAFGAGGVVLSDPLPGAPGSEEATGIAIDVSAGRMYLVGTERSPGGDTNWRFEKRRLDSGALDTTFGPGMTGVWGEAPSFGDDWPGGIAIDGGWMYLAGHDEGLGAGSRQWRIEKRSLATGLEDGTFGSGGIVISSPAGGDGGAVDISIDAVAGRMFVVGSSLTGLADLQWQIEKRDLATGAGDGGFGAGGILPVDPSPGADELGGVVFDPAGGVLILIGDDSTNGGSDRQWRIEKRQASDGALEGAFGAAGVLTLNPDAGFDFGIGTYLDGGALYVSGVAQVGPGFGSNFRIEIHKVDAATGSPLTTWGAAGIVTEDPSPYADGLGVLGADGAFLYLAGLENVDVYSGLSDQGWRIEKRTK